MTDRPIIFSAPMVRALLDGRKTQTRRLLGGSIQALAREPAWEAVKGADGVWRLVADTPDVGGSLTCNERYAPGDRLWVRENHYRTDDGDYERAVCAVDADEVREHLATIDALPAWFDPNLRAAHKRVRPSIHMPRWASRLTLPVTEVRVERLQDISESDAIAEGIERSDKFADRFMTPSGNYAVPVVAFQRLWESIHSADSWATNPWIVAVTFDVHRVNINDLDAERAAA